MNRNSLDDYKNGLKAKYEEAKIEVFSMFLLKPSPAELKNLCLLLYDEGIGKLDQEVFDGFFDLDDKSNKRKQIEHFNVDKLKPLGNFLNGKTETTRTISLDLIAVLVGFNPRPYRKFIAGNQERLEVEVPINAVLNNSKREEVELGKSAVIFEEFKNRTISNRMTFAILSLFFFVLISYGVKNIFFPIKNCMVWKKNHFEAADYDKVKDTAEVIPLNQELLDDFKKITVCDSTIFFKNGNIEKPVVWYGKAPNTKEYEYFNQPGLHPETGKTLKPITKYIIGKYIIK